MVSEYIGKPSKQSWVISCMQSSARLVSRGHVRLLPAEEREPGKFVSLTLKSVLP